MEWRHTVWPDAKLVYTSVNKVANTSIKSALLATFHPRAPRASPHDERLPYVEIQLSDIRTKHPDYLHVAFVRNPFDRLVSFWADKIDGSVDTYRVDGWLTRNGFAPGMSFGQAAEIACSVPDRRIDPHARSQTSWLLDGDGRLVVDLLLRFERLTEDWELLREIVRRRTGAELEPLPSRRVSQHRPFGEHYDDELWTRVAKRYAADIRVLDYPRDRHAPVESVDPTTERAIDELIGHALDARSVIDLSDASLRRARRVSIAGGHYLALADRSSVGQLVRTAAVTSALIPDSIFDALIVQPSYDRADPDQLVERFVASDRPVITNPARYVPKNSPGVAAGDERTMVRMMRRARRRLGRLRRAIRRRLRSMPPPAPTAFDSGRSEAHAAAEVAIRGPS